MIINAPPNEDYFTYDIDKLPLGFSEPTLAFLKDFSQNRNMFTRKLFKLLRNCLLNEHSVFCSSPVTAGEFAILLIRE
jgi:hypothetical protein